MVSGLLAEVVGGWESRARERSGNRARAWRPLVTNVRCGFGTATTGSEDGDEDDDGDGEVG